jgi:hypothetical protein
MSLGRNIEIPKLWKANPGSNKVKFPYMIDMIQS